jgi:hypothetical protein
LRSGILTDDEGRGMTEPDVIGGADAAANRHADRPAPTNRGRTWAILIVLILAGVGWRAWFYYSLFPPSPVEPKAFSSADWKELGRPRFLRGQPRRRYMAEDLLANHHLENMSRAEILDLLGPPDPGGFHSRDSVPYIFSYYLYPGTVEDWWLVVQFDVADLVIDASITNDDD